MRALIYRACLLYNLNQGQVATGAAHKRGALFGSGLLNRTSTRRCNSSSEAEDLNLKEEYRATRKQPFDEDGLKRPQVKSRINTFEFAAIQEVQNAAANRRLKGIGKAKKMENTNVMFLEDIDHSSGERIWRVAERDYDLAQEIARSGFADMMRDSERNRLFEKGLQTVIKEFHEKDQQVHVVDIGAGAGLLSLMAARAGAERVTAIEVFKPIADCARRIIAASDYAHQIDLITSRSTDLSSGDVQKKGNVIVAEVFDTELIGEGALRTFKEAHTTFAEKGCRVVPSSARVWVAPVESEFLSRFHRTPDRCLLSPFTDCPGAAAVFDLQLSEVPLDQIKLLAEPFVAFRFNFEDGDSIEYDESIVHDVIISADGSHQFEAVVMWWDLDMDGTGRNILNMAPKWWNSNFKWRDHWMQAVYYIQKPLTVQEGDKISLRCSHDEFSLWFAIDSDDERKNEPPVCKCKMHAICSRNSIYRLNHLDNDIRFDAFLQKECTGKCVLCVSEGSLLGLMAAKYAKSVIITDNNPHFRDVLSAYRAYNRLHNTQIVHSVDDFDDSIEVDLIMSEPFFFSSLLPWNNLRFWFAAQQCQRRLQRNLKILPQCGALYAMPVEFENLWKIAAPVGIQEGIDFSAFDEICMKARSATDAIVEPQPLWEYPSRSTGQVHLVGSFDLRSLIPNSPLSFSKKIEFLRKGTNGVAFWMNWDLGEYEMKSGLLEDCQLGERPKWAISFKQGVYFLPEAKRIDGTCQAVTVNANFCPHDGGIHFSFSF